MLTSWAVALAIDATLPQGADLAAYPTIEAVRLQVDTDIQVVTIIQLLCGKCSTSMRRCML